MSARLGSIALWSALLFVTACHQKENPEKANAEPKPVPELVTHTCRPDSVFYDDGSGPVSYKVYAYDAGNRIIKVKEFQVNNQLASYITYTYNSQGKAAEAIYFSADSTIQGKQIFTYNAANQLGRIDFKGTAAWQSGYYPVVPDHVVMHYNAAGQRTRTELYDAANVLVQYFEYTYNQHKIFAAEYDATTNPASLVRTREFHFDNQRSPHYALGYLDGLIPDMEKHNLVYSRLPAASWNSEHVSTTYQYNSQGYPISAVTSSGIGWGPSVTTYKYNCE